MVPLPQPPREEAKEAYGDETAAVSSRLMIMAPGITVSGDQGFAPVQ